MPELVPLLVCLVVSIQYDTINRTHNNPFLPSLDINSLKQHGAETFASKRHGGIATRHVPMQSQNGPHTFCAAVYVSIDSYTFVCLLSISVHIHTHTHTTVCTNERELLKKLFKDLVSRSQHPKFIDKATFCRVFPLPGILSEQLFRLFDKFRSCIRTNILTFIPCNMYKNAHRNKDDLLSRDEFFDGIATVLKGSIADKIKFVFELFDLDKRGRVSKDDLETVLNCIVSSQQAWKDDILNNDDKHTRIRDYRHAASVEASQRRSMKSVDDANNAVKELLEDALAVECVCDDSLFLSFSLCLCVCVHVCDCVRVHCLWCVYF